MKQNERKSWAEEEKKNNAGHLYMRVFGCIDQKKKKIILQ